MKLSFFRMSQKEDARVAKKMCFIPRKIPVFTGVNWQKIA